MDLSMFTTFSRVLLFVCLVPGSRSQITTLTGLDTEILNLVDAYFDKQGVVPVATLSTTMDVTVDMNLVSVRTFDDDQESIQISGYFTVTWTEERLTRTANTLTTTVKASAVWVPDLTLINCACSSTDASISAGTSLIKIDLNTGAIVWKPWFYGTVLCEPNMKHFPFDVHKCVFKYTTTHHTSSEVLLSVSSNVVNQDYYNTNNEWAIDETSAKSYVSNSLSIVEFEIKMKRKPQYMLTIILIPMMLVSLLNTFAFFIPAKTNQKIGFSVINLLGIVVLYALATFYIPTAAASMSLLLYFVFACLLINLILVIVVIMTERQMNICKSLMKTSSVRRTQNRRPSPRRTTQRVGDHPANTKYDNKAGINNGVAVTGSPLSVWDDDIHTEVVALETKGTNTDKQTDDAKDGKDKRKADSRDDSISSFDMICVFLFMSLHVICAVSFLTPLALNV